MKNVPPFLVAVAALGLISNVSAESVAINIWASAASEPNALLPGDTVGLPSVAQSHWNNLSVVNAGDGSAGGSMANLVDDSGSVSTMSILAGPGPKAYTEANPLWGWDGSEATMHTGWLNNDSQYVISGIPYAGYDVYVYLSAGFNGGNAAGIVSLFGAGVDPSQFYFRGYSWSGGNVYTQVTSTDSAAPGSGNYIVFRGNTADSFVLDFDAVEYDGTGTMIIGTTNFNGGVAGIQIVAVPEPASFAPIGLGGVFLATRRRRPVC